MTYYFVFDKIYSKYPSKIGKKAAVRHFNASVKTDKDVIDITKALDNYLNSERVKKGYIQNASTWFNNWRDWVDSNEPAQDYKCRRCGYECDSKVSPQYCIDEQLCFQCFKMKESTLCEL